MCKHYWLFFLLIFVLVLPYCVLDYTKSHMVELARTTLVQILGSPLILDSSLADAWILFSNLDSLIQDSMYGFMDSYLMHKYGATVSRVVYCLSGQMYNSDQC